jgi:hypothetical protein
MDLNFRATNSFVSAIVALSGISSSKVLPSYTNGYFCRRSSGLNFWLMSLKSGRADSSAADKATARPLCNSGTLEAAGAGSALGILTTDRA